MAKVREIDLGWDKVVLWQVSRTEYLMEPVGRKYRLERSSGGQWDVYRVPGNHHRGTFHSLKKAVEAALTEALINSGESAQSVAARLSWSMRKEKKRKAVKDLKRKRKQQAAALEKARDAKIRKQRVKKWLTEGKRPGADWDF